MITKPASTARIGITWHVFSSRVLPRHGTSVKSDIYIYMYVCVSTRYNRKIYIYIEDDRVRQSYHEIHSRVPEVDARIYYTARYTLFVKSVECTVIQSPYQRKVSTGCIYIYIYIYISAYWSGSFNVSGRAWSLLEQWHN